MPHLLERMFIGKREVKLPNPQTVSPWVRGLLKKEKANKTPYQSYIIKIS